MYNNRQQLILRFIQNHPNVSTGKILSYVAPIIGERNSRATIIRDLNSLVAAGVISKSGQKRGTVYKTSTQSQILQEVDIDTYFAKEQDSRLSAQEKFNFEIWNGLKDLLSAEEKQQLSLVNQEYLQKTAQLTPQSLQKEYERLTIELAWKSSKIEGNTYTLLDTERLLKENVEAKGKTKEEAVMIINHKKALDFIFGNTDYFEQLNIAKIEYLHSILVDGLGVAKGMRTNIVGIVGTNYRPLDNIYQIKEAIGRLVEIINKTENPLEKALMAVAMISYIQPFEDGNKRTSRILGNAILLAHKYCPLSYRSVDEIEYKKAIILFYEQNNLSYFKKLFLEQFNQAVQKYF